MKTRPATPRDLPQIMDVLLAGLVDDPVFDWTWRYRHQYPGDNYYYWSLKIASMITDSGLVFMVVELDDMDDFRKPSTPLGTVISFVVWRKEGDGSHRKKRGNRNSGWWLNLVDRTIVNGQDFSINKHFPEGRRDADHRRWAVFRESMSEISRKHFSRFKSFWEVELLATHRDYRNHGAATSLIKWGIEIADGEGIPCCVVSSPMGKPVYEASGFSLVEDNLWVWQLEGEEDRAESFIMVRVPKNQRVKTSDSGDGYMIVETTD